MAAFGGVGVSSITQVYVEKMLIVGTRSKDFAVFCDPQQVERLFDRGHERSGTFHRHVRTLDHLRNLFLC